MPYRTRDISAAVFCALAWAGMIVLRKLGLNYLHVLTVLVLSRVVTVLLVGAIMLAMKREIMIRSRGTMRFVVLLGFANLVLNWLGNQGMQWTTATSASMLFKTDVLYTIVLGWIFLGERVRLQQFPLIAIAIVGCVMVIAARAAGSEPGSHPIAGNIMCVVFGLILTLNAILIRAKLTHLGKMQLTFWNSFVGLLFFTAAWLILAAFGKVDLREQFAIIGDKPALIPILAGAAVASAATFVSYYQAIWNLPVWVVRVILLLSPACAIGLAAMVLGERPTPLQLVGMVLLLGGTAGVVLTGRNGAGKDPGDTADADDGDDTGGASVPINHQPSTITHQPFGEPNGRYQALGPSARR